MMLSSMKPEEMARAIIQGNAKALESIKGIGKKTAERMILELRDKWVEFRLDQIFPIDKQYLGTGCVKCFDCFGYSSEHRRTGGKKSAGRLNPASKLKT